MGLDASERRLLPLFAAMLSYPKAGVAAAGRACAAELAPREPQAAALVEGFAAFAGETSRGGLEEAYTATFDLNATCHPYVGYHLFGESYKRSVFLVRLKEHCRACGIELGTELPDHVAVVLSLLTALSDAELTDELIAEALLPALDRMTGHAAPVEASEETAEDAAGEGAPAPEPVHAHYRDVLQALRLVLRARMPSAADNAGPRPAVDPQPSVIR